LLIAAVAEREQVTLLHYDSDYDVIADITNSRCNGWCRTRRFRGNAVERAAARE